MKHPKTTAVILNWERHHLTGRLLESIASCGAEAPEVILVDNGSQTPGFEDLVKRFPQHLALRSKENLGFSRGCNLGIHEALETGCDFVAVLNSDLVVGPGFLDPIVDRMAADPRIGIANGWIAHGGTPGVPDQASPGTHGHIRPSLSCFNLPHQTPYLTQLEQNSFSNGCFLVLSRSALEVTGLFDEEFFFGYEDVELSWRFRESGFLLAFVPESRVWHQGRGSGSRGADAFRAMTASRLKLMSAYLSPLRFRIWLLWNAAFTVLFLLAGPLRRHPLPYSGSTLQLVSAAAQAFREALRGEFRTAPQGDR